MAQFSVHPAPGKSRGYVLNVQADLLEHLATRLVIPLLPVESAPPPARTLNPIYEVEGHRHVLATQYMAAIPANLLRPPVASLAAHRAELVAAFDFVLQGF
jgi:toxin CcdB